MELTLAGDVVIDVATRNDLDKHHDRIAKLLEKPFARLHRLRGGAPSTAAPVVVDLGKPPQGHIWLPQAATAWGNDAFTTVANVAWVLFAGPLPSQGRLAVGPPVLGLDGPDPILLGGNSGISVPSAQIIASTIIVWEEENLFAVFSGSGLAAGARNYNLMVAVKELPNSLDARIW